MCEEAQRVSRSEGMFFEGKGANSLKKYLKVGEGEPERQPVRAVFHDGKLHGQFGISRRLLMGSYERITKKITGKG